MYNIVNILHSYFFIFTYWAELGEIFKFIREVRADSNFPFVQTKSARIGNFGTQFAFKNKRDGKNCDRSALIVR